MSIIANKLLSLADSVANSRSSKLKIEIGEHTINYRYESTDNNDNSIWDNYYANAGIFFTKRIPEIQLTDEERNNRDTNGEHIEWKEAKFSPDDIREAKLNIISKAEVAPVMKTQIFSKLWATGESTDRQDQMLTATTIMAALILIVLITTMV